MVSCLQQLGPSTSVRALYVLKAAQFPGVTMEMRDHWASRVAVLQAEEDAARPPTTIVPLTRKPIHAHLRRASPEERSAGEWILRIGRSGPTD